MTKKIYFMLLSVLLSVTYLSAQVVQTVNVPAAGGLATAIGSNLKTVTDLTLTGTINATDFNTIKQMTALKNLDMSKVAVVDKAIPDNAFQGRVLNSLALPGSVTSIGSSAFEDSKIPRLVLPSSVTTIGAYCFSRSSIAVDFSKTKSSLTTLGNSVFRNYTGSKELDFSDFSMLNNFVVNYGAGSFGNYSGHVILPSHLETVPNCLFGYFKGSVSLSDNITSIGDYAFSNAEMAGLELPSKVKSIGESAFENSKIRSITLPSTVATLGNRCFWNSSTVVDFSQAKSSLTSLGWGVFRGYTGSSTLDFSNFSLLKSFGVYAGSGPFSNYTGHVLIPSNLISVPNYTFGNFKGSTSLSNNITSLGDGSFYGAEMAGLELPSKVKSIGESAFENSKIRSITLPSTVATLGNRCFWNSSTVVDFSQAKSSLTSLGWGVFWSYTGSSTLDFSDFSLLKSFGVYAGSGPFSNYTGHVLIPSNLVSVPNYTFGNFKGSTSLSNNITSLGEGSFYEAKITSIDIPAGVTSIGTGAFYNAIKLDTIISRNTTPPTLEANVFYGVNKETTVLKVPDSSINLYGTAAQWKDFLNISGRLPSKLDLTYKINTGNISYQTGLIEPGKPDKIVSYQAVRIGEYYWMNTNFNHIEPNISGTWDNVNYKQLSGFENNVPLTQKFIDTYLSQMKVPDQTQFRVDTAQFRKDFGSYYHDDTRNYMMQYGKIYENKSTENNKGWNMPYIRDYRQLIAMSPFFNHNSDVLSAHDAMYALAAGSNKNVMAGYSIIGSCNGNWGYWAHDFGDVGGDKYDFGLMPSGLRFNGPSAWGTEICGRDTTLSAVLGDLIQTYHRAILPAQDGHVSFHETISTLQQGRHDGFYCENGKPVYYSGKAYQWFPVRWCRVLTDEELGYKLYIKIDNIDKSSNEWKQFAEQAYELDLLNKMRNNNIPTDQTSIIKLGLNDAVPTGFIELPHGYIRGFYVQHILDKPNTTVTVSDVMKYAYNVQDFVLDYKQAYGRLPGWSTPSPTEAGACQPKTRSLVSDDVVVPFKTDASVTLYPNPVQDVLNISGDGVEKVSIYDMSGRQVSTAKNVNTISVSNLSKGTYLVRVLTANGESTHKVIKK